MEEENKKKKMKEALFSAIEAGDVARVRALLDDGLDVHVRNEGDWTPIHIAAKCGQTEVVRLLLDHNADENAMSIDDWTPLHYAAREGHVDVVRYLLDRRAAVDLEAKVCENRH
ncbi:hypothetical protein PINS_up005990 [Pythium insidiosum]|nr:hypothetical protein PINS_up005990 [Pythium insidiosum]